MDKRGIIDGVAKNSTSAGAAAAAGGGGGDCGDNDGNVEIRGGGGAGGGVERRLLFGEDEKDDDDSPATKKSRTGVKKTNIPQARGGGDGGGGKGSRRRNTDGDGCTGGGQQHDIGLPEEIFVFQGGGKNDNNNDHDGGDGGGGGGGEGGGHNNNDDDDEVRSLDGDDDLPQEREINLDPQEFLQTSLSRVMDEAAACCSTKKKKTKSTSRRTGGTTTTTTSSSSPSSSSSSSASLHDPIELHKVIDTITSLDERWKQYVSALLTNLEHQRHEEVRMVTEIAVENEERALSLQNDLDEERQRSSELTVALGENEQRMEILHHELNQERSNHLSLLNQQIDEMAEMKVTFASERHKLVEEHETELEQTKMTMQKEMESILLESIDMELTGVVNRHENETDGIIKEYEMKLHDAQGEIVRLKRKSVDDMKRLRRGLVKRYEDEKNRIVERHLEEMEEMKKSMSIMSLKKNKSSSGSTSREMVSYEEEKKEEHNTSSMTITTAIIQNGGEGEEYVIRSLREQLRCRDEKHLTEMEHLRSKLQMEADVTLEKLMAQHEKETACRALLDAEREEEVVQEHRIELKKTKVDLERSLRMEFDVTKQELISRQAEDREELILAHETELDDMRESLEEQFRFEWENVEVLPKDTVLVPAHYVYAFAATCTLYTLFK